MEIKRAMSPKEKRMLKAYRKRYMEDKDLQTISDELGISYSTVRKYFSGDQGQEFRRFFSEAERQFLQVQLKKMAEDSIVNSQNWISEGKSLAETAGEHARLAKEERETVKDAITMAQKLGLVDENDDDDSNTSGESVRFQLNYTEAEEHEKESEVET